MPECILYISVLLRKIGLVAHRYIFIFYFFFSSRRRHTRLQGDWSSDVCSSDLAPQVWALGLRNPWRFSFDRSTGDMAIGDVGSSVHEEIDFAPAGSGAGRNYEIGRASCRERVKISDGVASRKR